MKVIKYIFVLLICLGPLLASAQKLEKLETTYLEYKGANYVVVPVVSWNTEILGYEVTSGGITQSFSTLKKAKKYIKGGGTHWLYFIAPPLAFVLGK
jgi:hypothetical protein